MSPVVLIDANIPMYAAGGSHRLKEPCSQILVLVARQPQAFVTDAEVLQELLHRYLAQRLWTHGREVFQHFAELMLERVEPVRAEDVERAAGLADIYPGLDSRDLVHAAVMHRLSVRQIISADKGFDRLAGVERLDPAYLENWRASISS